MDRARQALWLQALQPIAEPQADRNSYGFRPKRCWADASFKGLRQKSAAGWILEGESEGFCDNLRFDWLANPIPMNRLLSKWLNSGFIERGPCLPPHAGVPQGGTIAPALSHQGGDGVEAVSHGSAGQRRVRNITYIRWADAFIVTAHSREVLEDVVLPRIDALLAERGVRLSPTKTLMMPLEQGVDF